MILILYSIFAIVLGICANHNNWQGSFGEFVSIMLIIFGTTLFWLDMFNIFDGKIGR
jgi:hypothetical protein